MRSSCLWLLIAGLPTATLMVLPAVAQVDESVTADDSGEIVDELVVYGERSGDPVNADPLYEQIWREQMLDQVESMRREEEQQWRNSNLTYQSSERSRIVWGYDPKADHDRLADPQIKEMSDGFVRPATLFRVKF